MKWLTLLHVPFGYGQVAEEEPPTGSDSYFGNSYFGNSYFGDSYFA